MPYQVTVPVTFNGQTKDIGPIPFDEHPSQDVITHVFMNLLGQAFSSLLGEHVNALAISDDVLGEPVIEYVE
jgi:hypothetical protein